MNRPRTSGARHRPSVETLRHSVPDRIRPPRGESSIPQISGHIEGTLGPIEAVMHEWISDCVHVDLHLVPPTPDCPHLRVVSSGMSDLPMKLPPGAGRERHLELLLTLPGDWRRDPVSLRSAAWYWPMRLLVELARLPHQCGSWLGALHVVANEDPPEPYAPGLLFHGCLLVPPREAPKAFERLRIRRGKSIRFLSVLPLTATELAFSRLAGSSDLLKRMMRAGIAECVDPGRRCALEEPCGTRPPANPLPDPRPGQESEPV
jgi:hypothetical protein